MLQKRYFWFHCRYLDSISRWFRQHDAITAAARSLFRNVSDSVFGRCFLDHREVIVNKLSSSYCLIAQIFPGSENYPPGWWQWKGRRRRLK